MTLAEFETSLEDSQPPPGCSGALVALWHAGRDDWHRAHEAAQQGSDPDSAWVHAHLHRIEGDLDNAGYWYRRAGRQAAEGAFEAEWRRIAEALLAPS